MWAKHKNKVDLLHFSLSNDYTVGAVTRITFKYFMLVLLLFLFYL